MKDDDGPLALKWLERRQRDRYHTKIEQEVQQKSVKEVLDKVEGGKLGLLL